MAKERSKHSELLNYFIYDDKDLSKEYVRKSKKFLQSIPKDVINIFKDIHDIPKNRKGTQ